MKKPNAKKPTPERAHGSGNLNDLVFGAKGRVSQLWEDMKVPLGWASFGFISISLLVIVSATEHGRERLAQFPVDLDQFMANGGRNTLTAKLDDGIKQIRYDSQQLAMERKKLDTRVAELENTLGDITASIPKRDKIETPETAAIQPKITTDTDAFAKGEPGMSGTGSITMTSRTQFGVSLAADSNTANIRTRWQRIMERHSLMLEGYEPIISVKDGQDGRPVLHLIAGPFSDITEAAALCAKLRSAGYNGCVPSIYDGQKLAVR